MDLQARVEKLERRQPPAQAKARELLTSAELESVSGMLGFDASFLTEASLNRIAEVYADLSGGAEGCGDELTKQS